MADRIAGPREPIVFYSGKFWYLPGFWYLAFTHYAPASHRPVMMLYDPADVDALAQLAQYPEVAFFGDAAQVDGPRWLPGWKPAGGEGIALAGWVQRMIRPSPASRPTILLPLTR
jgi:hypothetical protein